jgi:hypothetical protein
LVVLMFLPTCILDLDQAPTQLLTLGDLMLWHDLTPLVSSFANCMRILLSHEDREDSISFLSFVLSWLKFVAMSCSELLHMYFFPWNSLLPMWLACVF